MRSTSNMHYGREPQGGFARSRPSGPIEHSCDPNVADWEHSQTAMQRELLLTLAFCAAAVVAANLLISVLAS
jgi:hypothetical protein